MRTNGSQIYLLLSVFQSNKLLTFMLVSFSKIFSKAMFSMQFILRLPVRHTLHTDVVIFSCDFFRFARHPEMFTI